LLVVDDAIFSQVRDAAQPGALRKALLCELCERVSKTKGEAYETTEAAEDVESPGDGDRNHRSLFSVFERLFPKRASAETPVESHLAEEDLDEHGLEDSECESAASDESFVGSEDNASFGDAIVTPPTSALEASNDDGSARELGNSGSEGHQGNSDDRDYNDSANREGVLQGSGGKEDPGDSGLGNILSNDGTLLRGELPQDVDAVAGKVRGRPVICGLI
jgi:hypothetical protein